MTQLPDGIVAFVKQDCPTCELVVPVLQDLEARELLAQVLTQDDPSFPSGISVLADDTELEISFRNEIETVPTLIRVADGQEVDRLVGWSREMWEAFTGVTGLALDMGLPDHRPGCGSLNVDPDRVAGLQAKFGSGLASREVEFASAEDPIEAMYDRGWSDGLPLVPPTPERVLKMLAGTTRSPSEVVALCPPNLVELTVEKIAVNAVMAGCKPEYLPVVITALEAACTDEFNMHGLLCTTMAVGPVLWVNGPISRAIGMNSGINVLGQGNRANSTIGRALQLTIRNVGGGEPGGIDRSTQGNPGKIGLCFAEDEEGSPWPSYAESQGFSKDANTVTLFPGEGPRIFVDQLSRTPESLVANMAENIMSANSTRMVLGMEAVLVVSPEHASRFADAGWSKDRMVEEIIAHTVRKGSEITRGAGGIAEGMPPGFEEADLPKFQPHGLRVVYAGGPAGLFSAIIAGWLSGAKGSETVTREITP